MACVLSGSLGRLAIQRLLGKSIYCCPPIIRFLSWSACYHVDDAMSLCPVLSDTVIGFMTYQFCFTCDFGGHIYAAVEAVSMI